MFKYAQMTTEETFEKVVEGYKEGKISMETVKYTARIYANALLRQPHVSGSLPPVDDETATEPIQNALYATGKFTTAQCSTLADGILQYIKDAGLNIVGGNDR